MHDPRGLIPLAILTSTIVLIACSTAWGALGVASVVVPDGLTVAAHRFLCTLLATVTVCAVMVNLVARLARTLCVVNDGYVEGYTDGLDARPVAPVSPAVSRRVPSRR